MTSKSINPLISIIVPVYNVERYIARAIKSMTEQSYGNIEIILVDDGSKDGSGDIADKHAKEDSRITVIHQENSGVSVARNKGLDRAKGDYVSFIDPDDYLEPDAIKLMLATLQERGVDIVRTRCNTYRNDRKIKNDYSVEVGMFKGEALANLAYRAALHYTHDAIDSCCWLLLIKKDILDTYRIRFPKGIVIMQDTWFYVDLLSRASSLYSDSAITYNYMINENGTVSSKSRFAEKVASIVKLYEYVSSVWGDNPIKFEQLKAQYSALVAIRTINSSTVSVRHARELLKVTAKYSDIFQNAEVGGLSFRHKLYTFAVRRNSAFLVVLLAAARNIAIFIKG